MLRRSWRLVREQSNQTSVWILQRKLLRPRHLPLLSLELQQFITELCVAGWSAPEQTHPRHRLGLVLLSPPRVWLILITTMEPNSPKKIQFAVPLFQSQIAPEAAEQVRRTGRGPVIGYKVSWTYILVINWKLLYLLNLPNFVDFQDTWMRNKLVSTYALVFELHWWTIG